MGWSFLSPRYSLLIGKEVLGFLMISIILIRGIPMNGGTQLLYLQMMSRDGVEMRVQCYQ